MEMRLSLPRASMAAALIMLSLLAMNAIIGDSNSHMVALNDLAIVFINALAVVTLFYVAHHSDAQGSNAK
ncbi:MAG TPA: hypothetical protein VN455_10740, partial [Methanotrichaceae archaeon]|nr:hypothetical protein [Methanotrichaceae archaeon]